MKGIEGRLERLEAKVTGGGNSAELYNYDGGSEKPGRNGKMTRATCLCSLVILILFIIANIAVGIDMAIYTESFTWTSGEEEMGELKDKLQGRVEVELFGKDDLGGLADWVQDHTSGENNILILTGLVPTSIYPAGNAKKDGSVIEDFLDAGNTVINSGEYPFYSCEGAVESNSDIALREILDVPDAWAWPTGGVGWTDGGTLVTPTADGEKYTPSIVEFMSSRPLHAEHYDGWPWEVELVLAENTDDPNFLTMDPCVLVNTETGGRFGVFFDDPWMAGQEDLPRADVLSEYILNYYLVEVVAVEADGKMISTWGVIKGEH